MKRNQTISARDAKAILALVDTLTDWSDDFIGGPYESDWVHFHKKTIPKLDRIIAIHNASKLKAIKVKK